MARRKKPQTPPADSTLGPAIISPKDAFSKAHDAQTPAEEKDMLIGSRLSKRYRVLEKIGEGGMGRIYLAEDERLGKRVVVKMLPPLFAGRKELADRFVQEAKLTSKIEQENIVSITDLVITKPPFYVMEHLKGMDAGALVQSEGRLAWDERTKDLLLQVCRALGAAHGKGIVHRDMKPENIFLVRHSDGTEFVKILDFGIAKLLAETVADEKTGPAAEGLPFADTGPGNLTGIGMLLGTPHYMSPEQGLGGDVDARADIYAVGVIMYEFLAGRVPFTVPDMKVMSLDIATRIVEMHIGEEPVAPSIMRPEAGIPPEVEAIIMKALRKNPDERFPDMQEMAAAIEKCAAPRHRPRAKIQPQDSESASRMRSREGLARIRREEDSRRKRSRARIAFLIGALAAATAAGAIASAEFVRVEPAVDRIETPGSPSAGQGMHGGTEAKAAREKTRPATDFAGSEGDGK